MDTPTSGQLYRSCQNSDSQVKGADASVCESEKVKKFFGRPKTSRKRPHQNLQSLRATRLLKAVPSVLDNRCCSSVVTKTTRLDSGARAKLLRRAASTRALVKRPGGGREGPAKGHQAHQQLKMDAFVTSTESPSGGKAH